MIITKYNIVSAITLDDFLIAMQQCIDDGWQPIGGVTCFDACAMEMINDEEKITEYTKYTQAIVKYRTDLNMFTQLN